MLLLLAAIVWNIQESFRLTVSVLPKSGNLNGYHKMQIITRLVCFAENIASPLDET